MDKIKKLCQSTPVCAECPFYDVDDYNRSSAQEHGKDPGAPAECCWFRNRDPADWDEAEVARRMKHSEKK